MSNKPIRILQCVSNMDRAGIETMLMNYYRNIDKEKIQFDFLVNKSKKGAYDEEINQLGGKIYVSPGLKPFTYSKYLNYLRVLNLKNNYKIIHCQNEVMGYYALKAAKEINIPIRISHSHNTTIPSDYKFPIKLYCKSQIEKYANVNVACGKDAGNFLFRNNFKIIKNAIDTDKFIYNTDTRKRIRKNFDIENKFVIGHVGRFEKQKNHKFILKLIKKINIKSNNYIFILVGDGKYFNKFKNKVNKMGLSKNVIFTGNIPNVNEMYSAFDAFILPSKHEGLPVVGIEAQTCDLICFFSNRVTREIKILDSTKFLKLNSNLWVEELLKLKMRKRKNRKEDVIKDGYDIKAESKKLTDWYIGLEKGVFNNEK